MEDITVSFKLVSLFGILGNIVSFVVFLAPVPTFYRVFKKKSTEGFQSVPYVFALFSAMIWIYYALLKSNEMLLITINSFGCVIETIYITMFITYAPKQARLFTLRLLLLVNFVGFCLILLLSNVLAQGPTRVKVLGFVCVTFSVSVFAAPLCIMRQVIRTKSVEFMPISLSFFLTLSAIMWLFYGLLLGDLYVALPNVLGISFGVAQMILYGFYRNSKTVSLEKLPEHKADIVKETKITIFTTTTTTSSHDANTTDDENSDHEFHDANTTHDENSDHEHRVDQHVHDELKLTCHNHEKSMELVPKSQIEQPVTVKCEA